MFNQLMYASIIPMKLGASVGGYFCTSGTQENLFFIRLIDRDAKTRECIHTWSTSDDESCCLQAVIEPRPATCSYKLAVFSLPTCAMKPTDVAANFK